MEVPAFEILPQPGDRSFRLPRPLPLTRSRLTHRAPQRDRAEVRFAGDRIAVGGEKRVQVFDEGRIVRYFARFVQLVGDRRVVIVDVGSWIGTRIDHVVQQEAATRQTVAEASQPDGALAQNRASTVPAYLALQLLGALREREVHPRQVLPEQPHALQPFLPGTSFPLVEQCDPGDPDPLSLPGGPCHPQGGTTGDRRRAREIAGKLCHCLRDGVTAIKGRKRPHLLVAGKDQLQIGAKLRNDGFSVGDWWLQRFNAYDVCK